MGPGPPAQERPRRLPLTPPPIALYHGRLPMSDASYFAAATPDDDERSRLRLLEAKLDPATIRRMEALGVGASWRCLEVGAGGGSVARWLGERAGSVVVTDINPRFLGDLAGSKVEVRRHDVTVDPLEHGTFDLVHCRALLMHLREPAAALSRLREAVRPGGWLLVEESDYTTFAPADTAHPRAEVFARYVSISVDLFRTERLGDPTFGRKLPRLIAGLGLEQVGNEGVTRIVRGGEPTARYARMTFDRTRERLLAKGLVTPEQIDAFDAAFDDPTFEFVDVVVFGMWGRRPPSGLAPRGTGKGSPDEIRRVDVLHRQS